MTLDTRYPPAPHSRGDERTLGNITDIHRSSVVDGPGIRTTVFLKGCPLRCLWCHNPETQECHRQLGFNALTCIGCGKCVEVCPQSSLSLKDGTAVLDRSSCDDCLKCVDVCPSESLFVYGRTASADEIMDVVLKDKLYYDESGGGVTISGGEPMMQPDFTLELLKRCKEAGLHTCLDTTGVGGFDDFQKTLSYVDLYLFDYKVTDASLLKQLTGASKDAVMKTFNTLVEAGASIHLRCPMIPGVNDSDDHLRAIAELSRKVDLNGVDILTWHTMGTAKYGSLSRDVSLDLPTSNADDEQKSRYRNFMRNAGAVGVTVK